RKEARSRQKQSGNVRVVGNLSQQDNGLQGPMESLPVARSNSTPQPGRAGSVTPYFEHRAARAVRKKRPVVLGFDYRGYRRQMTAFGEKRSLVNGLGDEGKFASTGLV